MNHTLIKAFYQLAKSGNYRVAADKLFITQSALSKKIQRLEHYLGTTLFIRNQSGTQLTLSGRMLLRSARRVISSVDEFETMAKAIGKGAAGALNIGFGISTHRQAPEFIAGFKSEYPDVHITLNDIPSQKQEQLLLSDELQVSFNRLPVSAPLDSYPLCRDHLVVAVHKDEDIDMDNIFDSLRHKNFLRLRAERGRKLDKQIDSYLKANGISLDISQQANDILTLLSLVSANLGYTLLPSSAKAIATPEVRFIDLDGEHSEWQVGVIWNTDYMDPVRKNFIDYIIASHQH